MWRQQDPSVNVFYHNPEKAIEKVLAYCKDNGPIDAVVGPQLSSSFQEKSYNGDGRNSTAQNPTYSGKSKKLECEKGAAWC
eukprot:6175903-Amphidinium_carterae.2